VTGDWRRLRSGDVMIYAVQDIRVIRSEMSWVGCLARVERVRNVHVILVGIPIGMGSLGDEGLDWRIILNGVYRSSLWHVCCVSLADNTREFVSRD
jgi:hypothetical protein